MLHHPSRQHIDHVFLKRLDSMAILDRKIKTQALAPAGTFVGHYEAYMCSCTNTYKICFLLLSTMLSTMFTEIHFHTKVKTCPHLQHVCHVFAWCQQGIMFRNAKYYHNNIIPT